MGLRDRGPPTRPIYLDLISHYLYNYYIKYENLTWDSLDCPDSVYMHLRISAFAIIYVGRRNYLDFDWKKSRNLMEDVGLSSNEMGRSIFKY